MADKPLSEIVASIRSDLAAARGKLNDIGTGFTGWRERMASVEGLLTCGLVALHYTIEEMREAEAGVTRTPITRERDG